ncbi:MAG: FAD:protein FMN transferase [Ruminococcus sp.]
MKGIPLGALGCLCILLLTGCQAQTPETSTVSGTDTPESYEDTRELMGTSVMVRAYGEHAQDGVEAAFARAEELEQIFSTTIADSEICTVNQTAKSAVGTGESISIPEELCTVLETALEYGEKSGGALDCTMGDLIGLWGIGTEYARVPEQEEIQTVLRPDGWNDVVLDTETQSISFETESVTLHFGAIAKGYISDEMKAALQEAGVESALMSLGGNVMTLGTKPDGSSWNIAITNPFAPDSVIASLTVTDQAAVTSGNYEKYFEQDGKRYHHILDPKTGAPAESDVVSTTILASKGIDCDALSTATYIMGAEDGMALINTLDGIEAVFVTSDGDIITSDHIDQYQLQVIGT